MNDLCQRVIITMILNEVKRQKQPLTGFESAVVIDRGSVYHFEWNFYGLSLVLNQPSADITASTLRSRFSVEFHLHGLFTASLLFRTSRSHRFYAEITVQCRIPFEWIFHGLSLVLNQL